MRIETETGSVPNDTVLPLWATLFPGLIDPEKIKVIDGFSGHAAGALTGTPAAYPADGSRVWTASGSAFVVDPADGGYAYSSGTSDRLSLIDLGQPNHEVFARIKSGNPTVSVGIVFRSAGADYLRAVFTASRFAIQSRIGGVTTDFATIPFTRIADAEHSVRVAASGASIAAWVDDAVLLSVESSVLQTATQVGMFSTNANATFQIKEFVAGF